MPDGKNGPETPTNVTHVDFAKRTVTQGSSEAPTEPIPTIIPKTRIQTLGESPAEIVVGKDPITGSRTAQINRGDRTERIRVTPDQTGRGMYGEFDKTVEATGINPNANEVPQLPKHRLPGEK